MNLEKDESTILENDVQFEVPPVTVIFQTKPTYEAQIGLGLRKTTLNATICLIDTRVRPSLNNEDNLKSQ